MVHRCGQKPSGEEVSVSLGYALRTTDKLTVPPGKYYLELYHGVTSSLFGIGILLVVVSVLLGFRYFGRYRSPLFCIVPPFFPQKGGKAP
jgi:hypothetical protein